ncbi:MAG: DUF805 domain-containing protein, partial [Gammaproteobacteria bacterium]|nr:DUF805 domain-containing protein [Gammaproteobacteria bacterium]
MNWYLEALKKYAVFDGRARRKEYWFFILFYIIFALALVFVDGMTGTYNEEYGVGVLSGFFILAMLIPNIS